VAQDDVSLMRDEHLLSPRIEGLLSTQPSMEPVQEIDAVVNRQTKDQLVNMFEAVFAIRGQSLSFLFFSCFFFLTLNFSSF
jgi:hypothetical protein